MPNIYVKGYCWGCRLIGDSSQGLREKLAWIRSVSRWPRKQQSGENDDVAIFKITGSNLLRD